MCLQIREKEANVDNLINPIEDMYSLLMRYEVRVPKEETDMVGDLRYSWKKLRKLSTDVSDNLARLQVRHIALRRGRGCNHATTARCASRRLMLYPAALCLLYYNWFWHCALQPAMCFEGHTCTFLRTITQMITTKFVLLAVFSGWPCD